MFVTAAILLTVLVAFAVSLPLLRRRQRADAGGQGVDPVYRAQLREIEHEHELGTLDDVAYGAARAEIGRRLIAAEALRKTAGERHADGLSRHPWALAVGVLAVLAAAGSLYMLIGTPGATDLPLSARLNAPEPELAVLIAQVERHLAQNPDDVDGWDVIAPVYLRDNRLQPARDAYENAIRTGGPSVERLMGLGQTLVALNAGVVDGQASAVFRQLEALSPGNLDARFYLALADEQAGDHRVALDRFVALQEALPENAGGREVVMKHITFNRSRLDEAQGIGPSEQDIEAAASLSREQRAEMIEGMVQGLAMRLNDEPDDVDGWMRLIRSYAVLGDTDAAKAAVDEALAFFGKGTAKAGQIEALAAELSLSGSRS